jgi:hypothetical protein
MNHICVGASFTYHFPSKHMYMYIQGLASQNYSKFSEVVEKGAVRNSAFLIPSIFFQVNLEQRLDALNLWHDKIYWSERKLGIRFDHHDNTDAANVDYTLLSKDLNAASINIAYIIWSGKNMSRQLTFMDEIAERYKIQAAKNGVPDGEAESARHLLVERHAQLRSWNQGLEDRAEYMSKRAQALVQTVSIV